MVKYLGFQAGVLLAAASASVASTTTLFDSHGFESAYGYRPNVGLLNQPTGASPDDQWGQGGGGDITATVTTYANSTAQGVTVAVSNATSDESGNWYPSTNVVNPVTPAAGDHVIISWTQYIYSGGTGQPFFGIVAYNGNDALASVGVDATTDYLVTQDSPTDAFELKNLPAVTPNTYVNFKLDLDYSAQSFGIYENNALVDTEPFNTPAPVDLPGFTDADITSYVIGSGNATGYSIFDNYIVTQTSVPEPAMLCGWVAMLLLAQRRRAARC